MPKLFNKITIAGWRQLENVEIDFHNRLTIITGPNGTGKSTLLGLLNRHFGYNRQFYSTPMKKKKLNGQSFLYGVFSFFKRESLKIKNAENSREINIGSIEYGDESISRIFLVKSNNIAYPIKIENQQGIRGIHIDSHRPPSVYKDVPNISMKPINSQNATNQLESEFRNYYQTGQTGVGTLFHIKSALISMTIHGHGNPNMEPQPELLDMFRRFENKLSEILPESLGFEELQIRSSEVVLKTRTGSFIIDAASGGIVKLFEITWQLFFFAENSDNFVVTMDEPENHLHPTIQRTFLANFMNAFPQAQFIVVTHSPFIISSIKDSEVYVLNYFETDGREFEEDDQVSSSLSGQKRISSQKLDIINKAGTATQILREALGVPTTIPDWAGDRVKQLVAEYQERKITPELLNSLHEQLTKEGLISEYPKAVNDLIGTSR